MKQCKDVQFKAGRNISNTRAEQLAGQVFFGTLATEARVAQRQKDQSISLSPSNQGNPTANADGGIRSTL